MCVLANMAGISNISSSGWIIDSRANQHTTSFVSLLENLVDISNLDLKVGHPNGIEAKINKTCNIKITNSVTLFDVLVVPDFNVNLLSVYKLMRDNKSLLHMMNLSVMFGILFKRELRGLIARKEVCIFFIKCLFI